MLENCGFHASIGLRILMDKALISIDDSKVCIHELIQSMAFEIVRQECMKNPGGRSRLWNPNEIYDVLKNNQGSDAIQGISLDLSQIRDLQLSANTFKKMTNLRFLKFYSPGDNRTYTVNLPSRLESFSSSLRYIQWDNFPLESLPLSFCAEKLVELHMPNSHLKKLWDGTQNLVNLRKINLVGSKQLIELPNFSAAQNLKQVDLSWCESLCHLHPSILSLPRLSDLELKFCQNLKSLKTESQSKSLARLFVYGCYSLKEFSFSSDKLTYLRLEETGIEILDFSIGNMEKLQKISLNGSTLKNLPINEICCMRSLQQVRLYECGGIIDKSKLHTLFDALLSLKFISLHGTCKLIELPSNIKHLSRLISLEVSYCKDLQSLPELPPSIKELNACNCMSLKTLQLTSHRESSLLADEIMVGLTLNSSVSYLRNLRKLFLRGCKQLYELPKFIDSLSSLSSLDLRRSNVESLPASIKHLSSLKYIYLSNCKRLRSLPEVSPFIKTIHADGCISLENNSLSHVMENACFSLKQLVYTKQRGGICYPGRKAPEWFKFNQVTKPSNYITIQLSSTMNNLVGFICCSILSHHQHGDLQCQLHYDGKQHKFSRFNMMKINFDSHHVFLWCDPDTFKNFHKTMDDRNTNFKPEVSFEFSIARYGKKFVDGVIEACGVYPIYASEYLNFIQQMKLESNLGAQKETCHDVDENSFDAILKYASFSLKQGKCGNFKGNIIPEWFFYKSSTIKHGGLQVTVQLAPDFDNLMGFIFCFVIPHFSSKERDQCHSSCRCHLYDMCGDKRWRDYSFHLEGPIGWHYSMIKLNSDYVFLWYDPLYCECILRKLHRKGKGNGAKIEFGFKLGDGLIKECGVRPIYVSEYTNFLQQKNLKVSTQRKRHQDIDNDQHQLSSTKKLKESSIIQSIPLNSESKASHDVDELLLMLSQLNLESTKKHTHKK